MDEQMRQKLIELRTGCFDTATEIAQSGRSAFSAEQVVAMLEALGLMIDRLAFPNVPLPVEVPYSVEQAARASLGIEEA